MNWVGWVLIGIIGTGAIIALYIILCLICFIWLRLWDWGVNELAE